MEWRGSYCSVSAPGQLIVRDQKDWRTLWERIGRPAPSADLKKYFAAAVFLGMRPTGGWGVVFEEPVTEKGAVVIRWRAKAPRGFVTQALTQPYAVKLYPAGGQPARLAEGP